MTRRRSGLPAWLFRIPALPEAGFFLLTLTLTLIPWGNAATVPVRLLREITARLTPDIVPALTVLPEGLPLTVLTGTACVLCGTLQLALAVRRFTCPVRSGFVGFAGPFMLLLLAAGIHARQDLASAQAEMAAGTAALAVAASGYLFVWDMEHPGDRLLSLIRAFTLSCTVAGAVRLLIPDIWSLFDTGGTDSLAVPLGTVLIFGGVRFLTGNTSWFDTVLLLVAALETGWLHPTGALIITGTLAVITIPRLLRHFSQQEIAVLTRLLMLSLVILSTTLLPPGMMAARMREVTDSYIHFFTRIPDTGWAGTGPGVTAAVFLARDPWTFPEPVLPWPLIITLKYGLIAVGAYGWLWLMLFGQACRFLDTPPEPYGTATVRPMTARAVLITLFLTLPAMPAPPLLFLIPAAALAAAFPGSGSHAIAEDIKTRPAGGMVRTLTGTLLIAGLLLMLALNVVRFTWISREAGAATDAVRSAWTAEQQGDVKSALSNWSDAAWRIALLALLDESSAPEDSPAAAALRLSGMDRFLAETPGWFSHPDIREKLPGQWPLVKTALDVAHFGQARAAWRLGRAQEARHWLETVWQRTGGFWPEILAIGGVFLRDTGQPETGNALIRLAVEQARVLPGLPPWAPKNALSFSRFMASLEQIAP